MAVQKIKCSKCQELKKAGQRRYDKLIIKFGSEDELAQKYLCRQCRKE